LLPRQGNVARHIHESGTRVRRRARAWLASGAHLELSGK
jgi:hypothetical protein